MARLRASKGLNMDFDLFFLQNSSDKLTEHCPKNRLITSKKHPRSFSRVPGNCNKSVSRVARNKLQLATSDHVSKVPAIPIYIILFAAHELDWY